MHPYEPHKYTLQDRNYFEDDVNDDNNNNNIALQHICMKYPIHAD